MVPRFAKPRHRKYISILFFFSFWKTVKKEYLELKTYKDLAIWNSERVQYRTIINTVWLHNERKYKSKIK